MKIIAPLFRLRAFNVASQGSDDAPTRIEPRFIRLENIEKNVLENSPKNLLRCIHSQRFVVFWVRALFCACRQRDGRAAIH